MKKILVIEDNHDVRENLCEILEIAGYKTVEAENGKIGVEKARSVGPDLILCDVMMPELDGFGVLRIINRDPELLHVPFMFLTAKAEKTDFRKGMGLGADDYITKPFDEVELLDAIEMRLRKSEIISKIPSNKEGVREFFNEARAQQALQDLSEDREVRHYAKGASVFSSGQHPKYLYYILTGEVTCSRYTETGKELIHKIYRAGDFVGVAALIQGLPYQETAESQDAEIMMIPARDFNLLLFNDRDFSAKFIKILAGEASDHAAQLLHLAYSSVRKKVANALVEIATKRDVLSFEISREDLAAMAGTARESVARTLSDFKSEGLIDLSGSSITILQLDKLQSLPQ